MTSGTATIEGGRLLTVETRSARKEEEERIKKLAEEQKKSSAAPKQPDVAPRAASAPDAKPQTVSAQGPPPSPGTQVPGDDMLTKIRKEAQESSDKKSDARIEMLKQEFSASQQKFQQDIAHLAAQAKDAIAAREEAEKKLAELQSGTGKAGAPAAGDAKVYMHNLLVKLYQRAWADGIISPDERGLLTLLKNEIGLSDQDFLKMEEENRSASYIAHLRNVWKDGLVTPEESEKLEDLRKTLNISAEEHFKFEAQVRKEMQEKK